MNTQYVSGVVTTVSGASLTEGFPKIIFLGNTPTPVATSSEQADVFEVADPEDIVIESAISPSVNINDVEYKLVLGLNFSKCVFLVGSKNYIISKVPPIPTLSVVGTTLSWSNSYGMKTRIWKTSVYNVSNPSTAFKLVAEVDGPTLPSGLNSYLDDTVSLSGPSEGVSYYIQNSHGVSNIVNAVGL